MTVGPMYLLAALSPAAEVLPAWLDLGLSATLVALVVWLIRQREQLISRGEWLPRRELDYTIRQYDARLADKDEQITREHATGAEWRAAYETEVRARELKDEQLRDLIDAVRSIVDRPHTSAPA